MIREFEGRLVDKESFQYCWKRFFIFSNNIETTPCQFTLPSNSLIIMLLSYIGFVPFLWEGELTVSF
jgi:hypothetical protein